jgi:hypothetical protein
MRALKKSKLAEEVLRSGTRIPPQNGAKFNHEGKEYTVNIVPKASNRPKR